MTNNETQITRECAFKPQDHFIKIKSLVDEGRDENYLEVKYRIIWFNQYCMENGIKGVIDDSGYEYNPETKMYTAVCTIYMDGEIIAKAAAGQQYDGTNGNTVIQSVTTAAKGRALANAGFGTAMCGEDDEEQTPCEAGMPDKSDQTKRPEKKPARAAKASANQTPQHNTVPLPTSLDEAQAFVATTGQFNGRPMGEIYAIQPDYIKFCANKMNETRHPGMVAAARIIVENGA